MSSKTRDIILILVAVGLIAAALLPTGEEDPPEPEEAVVEPEVEEFSPPPKSVEGVEPGVSEAMTDAVHLYWPLVEGSTWTYEVESNEDITDAATWTVKIEKAPAGEEPGKLLAGFGKDLHERLVWVEGTTVRTDCLPFAEPLRFMGNRPEGVEGAFLPSPSAMIEGAVWKQHFDREVGYDARDRKGKVHHEIARAKQSDRATVIGPDRILTSAGFFDSVRVDWLSRLDMKAGARDVLARLTAEPYRQSTTWFAKGVGMVRMKVLYTTEGNKSVTFDLIRYERPGAPVKPVE